LIGVGFGMLVCSNAYAESSLSDKLSPLVEFKSDVKSDILTVGIEYSPIQPVKEIPAQKRDSKEPGVSTLYSLYGKVPTSKDDTRSSINESLSSWRIGIGFDTGLGTVKDSRYYSNRFAASLEGGYNKYEYFSSPDPKAKQSTDKLSFGAKANYFFFVAKGGLQLIPQVLLSYNRDYKDPEKTGVVLLDPDTNLQTVFNMALSKPTAKPELTARFALPLSTGNEFSFVPSIAYKSTGKAGSYSPEGKVSRLISQLFLYYYPQKLEGGGRIGLGPYVDLRTSGTDNRKSTEYGVVIDLRVATNMWSY
jgi:hypothetical protein